MIAHLAGLVEPLLFAPAFLAVAWSILRQEKKK